MPDPILAIVNALSTVLVTPSPAVPTTAAGAEDPSKWSVTPIEGTAYSAINTLLGVLFHATPDLTTASKTINGGLVDVVGVLNKVAVALYGLPSTTSAGSALSGLQQALALAGSLAPASAAPVISSGSTLFTQLSGMLSSVPSPQVAADEIAALAQQIQAMAALFPTS
jgi:hypothetical protein